jgi:hypothetical protein
LQQHSSSKEGDEREANENQKIGALKFYGLNQFDEEDQDK